MEESNIWNKDDNNKRRERKLGDKGGRSEKESCALLSQSWAEEE
jgi:hypothetical protein